MIVTRSILDLSQTMLRRNIELNTINIKNRHYMCCVLLLIAEYKERTLHALCLVVDCRIMSVELVEFVTTGHSNDEMFVELTNGVCVWDTNTM